MADELIVNRGGAVDARHAGREAHGVDGDAAPVRRARGAGADVRARAGARGRDVPDTGSGYGGKHTGEVAIRAARLAKGAGKPVKLVWSREEEFRWAYFRPAGSSRVPPSRSASNHQEARGPIACRNDRPRSSTAAVPTM